MLLTLLTICQWDLKKLSTCFQHIYGLNADNDFTKAELDVNGSITVSTRLTSWLESSEAAIHQ